jgi:hypothetical protein
VGGGGGARTGFGRLKCVHYSFGFTDDGLAHCREAYTSAETVLQHLTDVDGPLKAVCPGTPTPTPAYLSSPQHRLCPGLRTTHRT